MVARDSTIRSRKGLRTPSARGPSNPGFRLVWLAAATFAVALIAGLALLPGKAERASAAGGQPDSTVAAWNDALERAFGQAGQTPAEGNTYIGLLHYAIYDAVITVKGGYEPLVYKAPRQPNASAEAAVAAAGRGVLVKLLPGQAPLFEETYAAALNAIPDGSAKTEGIRIGDAAARAVLALPIASQVAPGQPYVAPSTAVGVYEPTAPSPVIGLWLSKATPVFLGSRAQFRPAGTLALGTAEYAADLNEVKSLGAKSSTTRTAAQTDQAMFWSEPAVQQALRSMRTFISDRKLDIVDAARFSAMIGGAYQEGMLACFDTKYALPTWRPVTAIRRADTDGNPLTEKDETWEPLLGTPNHPEYPSAHSCVTVGASSIVERFLGGAPFSYTMVSVAGRPSRSFTSSADFSKDVAEARIYGGIHFRQATIDGAMIGRQVADHIANNYFRPTADSPAAPLPPQTGNATAAESRPLGWTFAGSAMLLVTPLLLAAWLTSRRTRADRG